MSQHGELLAVVGPTASGKTALSIALAEALGGEIVSVDSAVVFRGLDIGTAKPNEEERARAVHHLIDVIEPNKQWSAADYARAADAAIAEIRARKKTPILAGGTGLWLRALVHGIFDAPDIDPELRAEVRRELVERGAPAMHAELAAVDPEAAARIQPNDPQRIGRALEVYRQVGTPISKLQAAHGFKEDRYALTALGITWPKDQLAARIAERTKVMYRAGLIAETAACLARGIPRDAPGLSIIGYRDAVRCVFGELSEEEAIEATTIATRQYAKRQRNWFRGEKSLTWIEPEAAKPENLSAVLDFLRTRS
jgi:tRNA dimethylallyltransferase